MMSVSPGLHSPLSVRGPCKSSEWQSGVRMRAGPCGGTSRARGKPVKVTEDNIYLYMYIKNDDEMTDTVTISDINEVKLLYKKEAFSPAVILTDRLFWSEHQIVPSVGGALHLNGSGRGSLFSVVR